MSRHSDLMADILSDMRVELADEFDRNFSRRGFFSTNTWARRKIDGQTATLQQSGKLRKSIRGRVVGTSVVFSSSEPYAAIHNEGGQITVTARMRKYFWAMYYKNGKRGAKAEVYKALALKPVGSRIVIPRRQFIGTSPRVNEIVNGIVAENVDRHAALIAEKFKQK